VSELTAIEQRIEALSDAERGWLIYSLAERHPRITKQLLDDADHNRKVDAARQSMPRHPLVQHERIPGLQLCYFRHEGAPCLRMADDPLHAMATASGGAR
jgi:hypothetical protein